MRAEAPHEIYRSPADMAAQSRDEPQAITIVMHRGLCLGRAAPDAPDQSTKKSRMKSVVPGVTL